jgi:hypothetical protein
VYFFTVNYGYISNFLAQNCSFSLKDFRFGACVDLREESNLVVVSLFYRVPIKLKQFELALKLLFWHLSLLFLFKFYSFIRQYFYPLFHARRRGKAFIFNHMNFDPKLQLRARNGTHNDRYQYHLTSTKVHWTFA